MDTKAKKEADKKTKVKTEAAIADADDSDATPDLKPPPFSSDVTTMLANAMNLVQDNEVLRDLIADAIASASE